MIFLWNPQHETKFSNNFLKAAYLFHFFQVPWGVPAGIICIELKTNENPNAIMKGRGGKERFQIRVSPLCAGGERTAVSLTAALEEMKY